MLVLTDNTRGQGSSRWFQQQGFLKTFLKRVLKTLLWKRTWGKYQSILQEKKPKELWFSGTPVTMYFHFEIFTTHFLSLISLILGISLTFPISFLTLFWQVFPILLHQRKGISLLTWPIFRVKFKGPFGQDSMNERPQILTSTFITK